MALKMSELSKEQQLALRALALKKVNKKLKTLETKVAKERKWAEEQMDLEEQPKTMTESDKVRVRLDARTTVLVSREKCVQQADGTWIKK